MSKCNLFPFAVVPKQNKCDLVLGQHNNNLTANSSLGHLPVISNISHGFSFISKSSLGPLWAISEKSLDQLLVIPQSSLSYIAVISPSSLSHLKVISHYFPCYFTVIFHLTVISKSFDYDGWWLVYQTMCSTYGFLDSRHPSWYAMMGVWRKV